MARYSKQKRVYKRKARTYKKRQGYVRPRKDPLNQPRVLVKHWYRDSLSQRTVVGNTLEQDWRINSLYDPDYTNASGKNLQPYGYDRYAAMYSYYQVKAIKITGQITISDTYTGAPAANVTDQGNFVLGCYPAEVGSGVPLVPTWLGEINDGKYGMIQKGQPAKFKCYTSMKKLTGMFGTAFNSGLGAYSANNPGNIIWATLKVAPQGNALEECMIKVDYKITFYTEWTLPRMNYYNDA